MNVPTALISDFDGTISEDDFFWYVSDKFLDDSALEPWNRYLKGEITHLEALNAIFAQIHIPESELLAFIDTIKIDAAFYETAELCRQKNIPLYICSAGCDYYIKRLIGSLIKEYDICLVTNRGVYSEQSGLKMLPPVEGPFYDPAVGISKSAVVNSLKQKGYQTVLAGDGPPDFAPAQIADVVFAKKILLEKCRDAKIKTQPFRDFNDVNRYLKEV